MKTAKAEQKTLNKVVRIGTVRGSSIFCKVEIKDGKLSMSGVIGPQRNGDATGGCGQISMGFEHRNPAHNDKRYGKLIAPEDIEYAAAWDADKWLTFLEIWHDWHLNDMRAGCVHQRSIDTREQVEVVTYHLTKEARKLRSETLREAAQAALDGKPFSPSAAARALALLESDWSGTHFPPDADSPLSGCYEVTKRETKAIGWVRPSEHPKGLLCKPCPVCGYKYGTEWLSEPLPKSVVEFLQSLPDADIQPAWA